MNKGNILSILFCICLTAIIIFAFSVGINDCRNGVGAFAKSEDVYPVTARLASKNAVYPSTDAESDSFTDTEPETAESEVFDEQETSEETTSETNTGDLDQEYTGDETVPESMGADPETEDAQMETEAECYKGIVFYGIWTGQYWHFTPEQIDAQWRGLKTSKPRLADGTTRAWQKYLYDRLSGIGAEWFFKFAVAQAMQESGFNPLNQQGNDAVPDKGLFSFRIYYWNSAYGDVFDYRANINAYVDRIAPYLTDSSEQGIYRAISQHYQPNGQTNMTYVNQVLGRLNELWGME